MTIKLKADCELARVLKGLEEVAAFNAGVIEATELIEARAHLLEVIHGMLCKTAIAAWDDLHGTSDEIANEIMGAMSHD